MNLFKKKEKIIPYLFSAKEAYKQYECMRNNGRTQEQIDDMKNEIYQSVSNKITNAIKKHKKYVSFDLYKSTLKEDYELYCHILKTDLFKDLKGLGYDVQYIPFPNNEHCTLNIDWSDGGIWKDY